MQTTNKKRIGILRGGAGKHYHSSLKKGGEAILHIHEHLSDKYKPVDVFIDQEHVWHVNGVPANPADLMSRVDVVWNMSHPSFSNILESLSIPDIGPSSFSSALQTSREMLREHMKKVNVSMPRHIVLPLYQRDFDGERNKYAIKKAKEVFEKFGSPWIVKSFTSDQNMGMHLAKTFPELVDAIQDGVNHEKSILIEEFIPGKVASMHSVAGMRGEDVYTFPLGNTFGSFLPEEKEKLINLAKVLHSHLGAKHYLKSDFVMNPRGKIYLLNIELNPDLSPDSHFSQVCESVGSKPHSVIEHILEQAFL